MATLFFRDFPLTMLERRRRLSVAAFILLAAAAAPLAAQQMNTAAPAPDSVGPPQLKDFRLPGQRTTPPEQTRPQPQPQQPTAQPPAAQPQRTQPVADRPAPRTQPAPAGERPAQEQPARQQAAAQSPAQTAPAPVPQAAPPPAATRAPGFESALPAGRPAAPAPAAASGSGLSSTLPWIGGAVLLLILGLFGFRRFAAMRAAAARQAQREARAAQRAAVAEAAAAQAAAAEAEAAAAAALPRARLELAFVPERAVATDAETIVHYELIIRNVGEDSARNIRIDTKMFNASAQRTISTFLKGAVHDRSGSPLVRVAPGAELKLSGQIAMPKDQVRGIEVQGRSIFVPVVAINVAYDWGVGDTPGSGRTSMSWLVGREPETPSDKMGPFRLDVGPRVYRSVGQRPTELANVA